jgi:hypothetical protein
MDFKYFVILPDDPGRVLVEHLALVLDQVIGITPHRDDVLSFTSGVGVDLF